MIINRRFALQDGTTFRVVKIDGDAVIATKRGQRAMRLPLTLVMRALAKGAIADVTDGRPCPECQGTMNRESSCRIERWRERVINGYYDRNDLVREVTYAPVWLCSACEHTEEER